MAKKILYQYNPETDNFERAYPSLKTRIWMMVKVLLLACLIGSGVFLILYYNVQLPTDQNLIAENRLLKSQYNLLSKRLDNTLKVMDKICDRDDNFYRVMMQMDPMSDAQRLSGLDKEKRTKELDRLSDAELVKELSKRMDVLEQKIYAQIQSFDQLKVALQEQKDRLAHIPSVMPINIADYTMSSGYGYREDPLYGSSKFHAGLDFAAAQGTPVFATADGKIGSAERKPDYGNCIDIDHGYNYLTRYAHLSEVFVKPGQEVKRGQLIGRVGSTGKSTGPHLHYEVRFKDEPQNPVNYYFMDLTPEQYDEMIQLAENAGHVMD